MWAILEVADLQRCQLAYKWIYCFSNQSWCSMGNYNSFLLVEVNDLNEIAHNFMYFHNVFELPKLSKWKKF